MKLIARSLLLVLAGVLFFGAVGLVLTWAPDQPVDELKVRWATPPSRFIEVNGQQVHLRDEGPHDDPAPIVLLHGTSASLHTWEGWARALREQRRVIRIDLPGFGLTGPNRQNDYSIDAYVLFVRAVMDKLGVQRFVLAGNSLGGQIAWTAAAQMPDRVTQLILVDASGYPPESIATPQSIPLGFRVARTPGLRLLAEYILPRGLVERTLREVYGDPSKITSELVDQYSAMTRREGNRQALGRRLEQGYTGNVALLKSVTAPTLVLWGSKDRLIPLEAGQRFARDISGAKLVVFDGLGHVPQEEDPARTVAEVKRFLGL
ncbi:MAG TPA: alpha/beta hydrolase [Ramlibacter sp.]|nr:alpha/beta hydrolase [Ramlibacter sp.]